jgi:hypothetical protein
VQQAAPSLQQAAALGSLALALLSALTPASQQGAWASQQAADSLQQDAASLCVAAIDGNQAKSAMASPIAIMANLDFIQKTPSELNVSVQKP